MHEKGHRKVNQQEREEHELIRIPFPTDHSVMFAFAHKAGRDFVSERTSQ